MAFQRQDLGVRLTEIKEFFGKEWFETELGKAGRIPDPKTTHPVIYSWHKTDSFLTNKNPLPGLKLIPRNDLLRIMMLGSYLRSIESASLVDLEGNALLVGHYHIAHLFEIGNILPDAYPGKETIALE